MKVDLCINYQDVFKEAPPELEETLKSISSSVVLTMLALLNSMVQQRKSFDEIFDIISRQWTPEVKLLLKTKTQNYYNQHNTENIFFNRLILLRFIDYEFKSFRALEFKETTSIDDYNIFKAYLIISSREGDYAELKFHEGTPNNELWVQSKFWPSMINQFKYFQKVDISLEMFKSLVFFDSLAKDHRTSSYLEKFCRQINIPAGINYVQYITIILSNKSSISKGLNVPQYQLKVDKTLEPIVRKIQINQMDLIDHPNAYSVYSKPIFHRQDGVKVILDWDLLSNQLYTGAMFTFFFSSGIKEVFKDLPTFKGMIGKNVIEDRVFVPIIKKIFSKKHIVKIFDEDKSGYPDSYIRDGNRIYIFEFKDNLFPGEIINESDFETFKNKIHENLVEDSNGKNRGIGQLANTITKLSESEFYGDDFISKGVKIRNLKIFPILVSTESIYNLYGVNDYLTKEFRKRVIDDLSYKKIIDPTYISLKYLYRNITNLRKTKLSDLILEYHRKSNKIKKNTQNGDIFKYLDGFVDFSSAMNMNKRESYSPKDKILHDELFKETNIWENDINEINKKKI